jgi:exosome complex RNA-binding protein Csl4
MTSSLEAPPQVAVDDLGSPEAFLEAIDKTIKYFNDGDIVTGTVVKVDRDEVLLDIGYKDRRGDPFQRALHQARRRPVRRGQRLAMRSKLSSSRKRTRRVA